MSESLTYTVIHEDDITASTVMPALMLEFGPARKTVKWRGKRFNLRSSRVIGAVNIPLGPMFIVPACVCS